MTSKNNNSDKDNSRSGPSNNLPSNHWIDLENFIETLTLRAMTAGNSGDFETAYPNLDLALWFSQSLDKKCLEAVLLNNMGILHTLEGAWDKAMLCFERSMEIAMVSCPSDDKFLATISKNISCLFDPKIAKPSGPGNDIR